MTSRRLRAATAILLLSALAITSLVGCGRTGDRIDQGRSTRLDQALEKLLADPHRRIRPDVRLRDLTDFSWDTVYVWDGEGISGQTIRNQTGHKIIDDDERFWRRGDFLVFTDGPKLAAVLSISYMLAYNDGDKHSANVLLTPSTNRLHLQEPGRKS